MHKDHNGKLCVLVKTFVCVQENGVAFVVKPK